MKKILVTGGAGFIGSHICRKLLELGHYVYCIDNLSTGNIDNIRDLLSKKSFYFIHDDINNLTIEDRRTKHMLLDVDVICHQAAMGSISKSITDPQLFHNNNVNGFLHILELARTFKIKRLVYASSSSVYGNSPVLPRQESFLGECLAPYPVTKRINELHADLYHKCYGLETIGLRYFNVFGPNQNPDGEYAAVIPKFIKNILCNEYIKIYGDGFNTRDFTYVENVVEANILAIEAKNPDCFGTQFNIGTGNRISINQLAHTISRICGNNIELIERCAKRRGDVESSFANLLHAKNILGYDPRIQLVDGLEKTIEFYKTQIL